MALVYYTHYNKLVRVFAVYVCITGVFEAVLLYSTFLRINNLPLLHVLTFIELIFLSLTYYYAFSGVVIRRAVIILCAGGLLFTVINVLFLESIWAYNSNSLSVESLLLVVFSVLYFYQMLQKPELTPIEKQAFFWINSGVLVYFAGNIFIFVFMRVIIEFNLDRSDYYTTYIHSILNITCNLLFGIGLWCKPQTQA